jgi:hypothetical protein
VLSALGFLGEGPRTVLQAENDVHFNSSTILQAQADVSQTYEKLRALAKVMPRNI